MRAVCPLFCGATAGYTGGWSLLLVWEPLWRATCLVQGCQPGMVSREPLCGVGDACPGGGPTQCGGAVANLWGASLVLGVVLVAQSCPTLCDPTDCSLPSSSVHGILQARSALPFPSPGDLPNPGAEPGSPAWQAGSLPSELQRSLVLGHQKDAARWELHWGCLLGQADCAGKGRRGLPYGAEGVSEIDSECQKWMLVSGQPGRGE